MDENNVEVKRSKISNKIITIGLCIVIILMGVFLYFHDNMGVPAPKSGEVIELTDKAITEQLNKKWDVSRISACIFSTMLVFMDLIFIYAIIMEFKRKNNGTAKIAIAVLLVLNIIFGATIFGFVSSYKKKTNEEQGWYVKIYTVEDKSKGNKEIYYVDLQEYKSFGDVDVQVNEEQYELLSKGSKVYAVFGKDGTIKMIYGIEQYNYKGDKLIK